MDASLSAEVSSRLEVRRAIATLVTSTCLFAVMAIGTRLISARIPGPEVALVRFACGLLVVLLGWGAGRIQVRPRRWGWLVARGIFGGVAVLGYFATIEHAGVGIATLLNYTAPAWSLLFGWWLLGERPRRSAVMALLVALAGVLLVLGGRLSGLHAGFWEMVGFGSAVLSALALTSIRAVRRSAAGGLAAETAWTVFASFTTLGIFATLPAVVGPFGRWVAPTPREWPLLLGIAACSVMAQLLMTEALQHVTASAAGIIHQLAVVITMAVGIAAFGEPISLLSLVGSALTITGVALTVLAARPSPVAILALKR